MPRQDRVFLAALVASSIGLGAACAERPRAEKTDASAVAMLSAAPVALQRDMRELWTDHTVWTRDYIIAALGDQPDAQAALDRLMANQEDIGDAIGDYYGRDAGRQLTTLLKQHIEGAGAVVKAAKSGNQTEQKRADDRWHDNAAQIAELLSKANPNWSIASLQELLNEHLSTTAEEVTARLKKDWAADVKAFDKAYDHILKMSDAISDGIVKQFPDKFGPQPKPAAK